MQSHSNLARLAAALGGLPILGCLEGSPAAEAGLRFGDVLLALDDQPVPTWDDFIRVRSAVIDRFVARVFRDGAELVIAVELRPSTRTPVELLAEMVDRGPFAAPDSAPGSDPDPDAAN